MSESDILNHRKNKFLSIGRNKGFTSKSNLSENLIMKENYFDNYLLKFKKNKNLIFISLFLFLIILVGIIIF